MGDTALLQVTTRYGSSMAIIWRQRAGVCTYCSRAKRALPGHSLVVDPARMPATHMIPCEDGRRVVRHVEVVEIQALADVRCALAIL
jgi:hypothetical protein